MSRLGIIEDFLIVTFEFGRGGSGRKFQANLVKGIVEGTGTTEALRHEMTIRVFIVIYS